MKVSMHTCVFFLSGVSVSLHIPIGSMYPKIYLTLQSNPNAGKFTSPMDSTVGRRNPAPYVYRVLCISGRHFSIVNSMIKVFLQGVQGGLLPVMGVLV